MNHFKFDLHLNFTNIIGAIGFIYAISVNMETGVVIGAMLVLGRKGIAIIEKYIDLRYGNSVK